ncbi:3-oxoacid CoA-transferase subunit B [Bacillus sp. JJ1764]|uniref:3-oxoacid CoA-transferase subunit B n=1 Tax=Bacillus sp. JJ1764 TaxID=3122964 RepID=UPI002FFF5E34
MDKLQMKTIIAKRIADELKDNSFVNLGVGLPTMVAEFVAPERNILLQGENGIIGIGRDPKPGEEFDPDILSSSGYPATAVPGASYFDSATSFGMIRGGHVDVTVLGTMQVDELGNIANYQIPGKRVTGMGGAMDLCVGSKKVIVATFHTNGGSPKILSRCSLPLTAKNCVNVIVTEMGVMDVTSEGIVLREYNPIFTIDEIQAATGAKLIIPKNIKEMNRPIEENNLVV